MRARRQSTLDETGERTSRTPEGKPAVSEEVQEEEESGAEMEAEGKTIVDVVNGEDGDLVYLETSTQEEGRTTAAQVSLFVLKFIEASLTAAAGLCARLHDAPANPQSTPSKHECCSEDSQDGSASRTSSTRGGAKKSGFTSAAENAALNSAAKSRRYAIRSTGPTGLSSHCNVHPTRTSIAP